MRFAARIGVEWMKIHAKKLEGADTDLCVREAYDVYAMALRDFGVELDDAALRQDIPALILYNYGEEWLAAVPREQRYLELMQRVSGRIVYWQAEELEKQKSRSPLQRGREANKEMGRLMAGPHEKIHESLVRATLAQEYGIKPEEVTWDEITLEVESLGADYPAIELVRTASATEEDSESYFFYDLPARMTKEFYGQLSAFLAANALGTDESPALSELEASPPTPAPSDESRRPAGGLLDGYLLEPVYPAPAQSESTNTGNQAAGSGGDESTRTEAPAVEKTNSNEKVKFAFPARGAWLRARLTERAWDKHAVYRQGGPHYKTVQKILDGKSVQEDVLGKLATALSKAPASKKLPAVKLLDIPRG